MSSGVITLLHHYSCCPSSASWNSGRVQHGSYWKMLSSKKIKESFPGPTMMTWWNVCNKPPFISNRTPDPAKQDFHHAHVLDHSKTCSSGPGFWDQNQGRFLLRKMLSGKAVDPTPHQNHWPASSVVANTNKMRLKKAWNCIIHTEYLSQLVNSAAHVAGAAETDVVRATMVWHLRNALLESRPGKEPPRQLLVVLVLEVALWNSSKQSQNMPTFTTT